MNKFESLITTLPDLLKKLERQPYKTREDLYQLTDSGIYVFYENGKAIYVGRSNRLKARIQEHGRPSSTCNSAPFAFNLAKEEFRKDHPNIDIRNMSRKDLENLEDFQSFFVKAKNRVANMQVRILDLDNQNQQALFEICAALALDTKYNDFNTH